ncbi:phosphoesterase [Lysobacter sp. F6437]|uniref:phosphoesterase n=1 Tax=Lysobacter sp. F6437 TaxID=3459296 RepID=UPI00403D9050
MKQHAARFASVLIHPAVVMSAAAAIAAGATQRGGDVVWQAPAVAVAAAVVVMLYSAWQARSGRWSHIDASQGHERSQLNRFASWVLLALAALLAATGAHPGIVIAIALSGLIVLIAHLLRGRLKSSLHVAFAAFATCLVWPHPWAFAALLLATGVVAWSRLVLRRHGVSELIVGAVIGLACGGLNGLLVAAFASA